MVVSPTAYAARLVPARSLAYATNWHFFLVWMASAPRWC